MVADFLTQDVRIVRDLQDQTLLALLPMLALGRWVRIAKMLVGRSMRRRNVIWNRCGCLTDTSFTWPKICLILNALSLSDLTFLNDTCLSSTRTDSVRMLIHK